MFGIDWPKPKRMTRTHALRATRTRYALTTRNLGGDINHARGGAGCYIQARAHPPTRDPPNHTSTVPALYTYYFAHFTTYSQDHPPIQCQIKTPHPHIFPSTICLARTQKHPPVYGTLTRKTPMILFRVVHCMTFSGGVAFSLSSATPLFPFTFPPSCCYTHAFTASLKPDAAPHARYKSRTYQGT